MKFHTRKGITKDILNAVVPSPLHGICKLDVALARHYEGKHCHEYKPDLPMQGRASKTELFSSKVRYSPQLHLDAIKSNF